MMLIVRIGDVDRYEMVILFSCLIVNAATLLSSVVIDLL
jgi:hypothetical protein